METLGTLAALLAVAVLVIVIVSVAVGARRRSTGTSSRAAEHLRWPGWRDLECDRRRRVDRRMATAMALPLGVLIAIYLTEFAPRAVAGPIQLVLDVLNGLPTIVIGVFVYGLLVVGTGRAASRAPSPLRS